MYSHLNGKDESHASQQWTHDHSYHGDEESPGRRRSWLATLTTDLKNTDRSSYPVLKFSLSLTCAFHGSLLSVVVPVSCKVLEP